MSADTPKGYTEQDVQLVAAALWVGCRDNFPGLSGSPTKECVEDAHLMLAALAGAGRLRSADDGSARAEVESLTDQLGDMRASVSAAEAEVDDLRGRLKAAGDAYNELANERAAGRLLPEDTRRHAAAVRAERDQYAAEIASLRGLIGKYGDDGMIPASALRKAFRDGPRAVTVEDVFAYELGLEEGHRRERDDLTAAGRLLPEDTRTEWAWEHDDGCVVPYDEEVDAEATVRAVVATNGGKALYRRVGPWVPVPEPEPRQLSEINLLSYGPVAYPPHPSWVVQSVEPAGLPAVPEEKRPDDLGGGQG